jgi:uncharacterized beta-barrel protein YwiB (DUF1934 family)
VNQPNELNSQISVTLQIISTIRDNEQIMEEEQLVQGRMYNKDGSIYLRYEETLEGAGTVQNTLKISDEQVTIIRQGVVRMNHTYKLDEETRSFYQSPHGRLEMLTNTHHIQFSPLQNKKGRLLLHYDLELGGSVVGLVNLTVEMKEKG